MELCPDFDARQVTRLYFPDSLFVSYSVHGCEGAGKTFIDNTERID